MPCFVFIILFVKTDVRLLVDFLFCRALKTAISEPSAHNIFTPSISIYMKVCAY